MLLSLCNRISFVVDVYFKCIIQFSQKNVINIFCVHFLGKEWVRQRHSICASEKGSEVVIYVNLHGIMSYFLNFGWNLWNSVYLLWMFQTQSASVARTVVNIDMLFTCWNSDLEVVQLCKLVPWFVTYLSCYRIRRRLAEAAWFSHLLQLPDHSHQQHHPAMLLQLLATLVLQVAHSQYQLLTPAHGLVSKMVNTASCFAMFLVSLP